VLPHRAVELFPFWHLPVCGYRLRSARKAVSGPSPWATTSGVNLVAQAGHAQAVESGGRVAPSLCRAVTDCSMAS
jgi:hypothetical protein